MDGVIMRKIVKVTWVLAMVLSLFLAGMLIGDKIYLRENMIRLRVVAASDSPEDQQVKLQVKDAVNDYLQESLRDLQNTDQVRHFLENNLSQLTKIADDVLDSVGNDSRSKVYLTWEAANSRDYETFSLPSGIYETLRVDIGPAGGENWWCVVFPSLCVPESREAFASEAEAYGMRPGLTAALTRGKTVKVRFFLLDCIGKIENILKNS